MSRLGFILLSEQWYGAANLEHRSDHLFDEVQIGRIDDDRLQDIGTFEFHRFQRGHGIRFSIFEDSWSLLAELGEFFSRLTKIIEASGERTPSPQELAQVLEEFGLKRIVDDSGRSDRLKAGKSEKTIKNNWISF